MVWSSLRGLLLVVVLLALVPWFPAGATQVPYGIPETGPDRPAFTLDHTDVVVFDNDRWSWTEGRRNKTVDVPDDWSRAFVIVTIRPAGDPWDRLFAVSLGPVEVLHGTTPRADMTVQREVTRYGAFLPPGGDVDVGLYLGTWVGALEADLVLRFYHDDPVAATVSPAEHVVPVQRFQWHAGHDLVHAVTFPDTTPSSATLELFTSGHGGEEFWYQSFPTQPRSFRILVDGEEVARVVAIPYVYALLGFSGGVGNIVHGPMWWTAQQGLDVAGAHTGPGEIPPYQVDVDPALLPLLSGQRNVTVETTNTRGSWMTSIHFLLD